MSHCRFDLHFLMTNGIEYFSCLLMVCISSFEVCLIISFTHYKLLLYFHYLVLSKEMWTSLMLLVSKSLSGE